MDLSVLPDIFALTVFIAGFRPLVRRVGSHVNLWFLGWGLMLVHYCAMLFVVQSPGTRIVLRLIAVWSVDLCACIFVMAAAGVGRHRVRWQMVAPLGLPVMFQSAFCLLFPQHSLGLFLVPPLYLAPALSLLIFPRQRTRGLVVSAAAFAVYAAASVALLNYFPTLAGACGTALLFLCAAYIYVLDAQRFTRGTVAAILGLIGWALIYPAIALIHRFGPAMPIRRELTELPQFLVLAGIILTLLEEHVDRTERMAMHDPLTDLPNRRLFEERLIEAMDDATANRTTIACLVIDVDNFKSINDTLGHEAGDQLLRALAVRLSWHMSPRDILARTGGDEFTALLAGVRDEHHLRFIASAMMSAASVPLQLDCGSVDVRISIGIALSPDHADDIDSLRRAADEAMYSAKRRGGSLLAFAGEDSP